MIMEIERKTLEETQEEMYFEMDLTHSKEELLMENNFDDSSILPSYLIDKQLSPNLDSPSTVFLDQMPRNRSYSIPIHTYSQTSTQNLPSTWGSFRIPSPPSQLSCSVSGTPASSASPSSSFIPRKLRESFSKLLKRGSFSRARSPGDEQACSDSECYNCEDRRASECSIVSPATEEVVNESLRNGLPIIPFAYPTFFMAGKNQEVVQKGIRKNSLKRLKRSFSRGNSQDVGEEENCEDKSLDSIVRMAKQEMESYNQGMSHEPVKRKESQSSYVEMDPGDMSSIESGRMMREEDAYMRMEDLQMGWKKESDQPMFHLEENHEKQHDSPFLMPHHPTDRKQPKRKNNFLQTGKNKEELQIQESMERQFKKGNKHKDDYAFFDFEQNKDYVDMSKAKTNKWHFLDFNKQK